MISIGLKFHDGYDKINALWVIKKKLPNNQWLCCITDEEYKDVTQVYDEDTIELLKKWDDVLSDPTNNNRCKNCNELISNGYVYCYDCEFEVVSK